MIAPDEGAYAFEALLRHDRAYTGYAPIIGNAVVDRASRNAARSPKRSKSIGQSRTGTSKLRAELDDAAARTSGRPGCGVWSPSRSA